MKATISTVIDLAVQMSMQAVIVEFRNNRARMFLGNRNEYCTFWI